MSDNRAYKVEVVDRPLTVSGRITETVIDVARGVIWISDQHDPDRLAKLTVEAGRLAERERQDWEAEMDAAGVPEEARPAIRQVGRARWARFLDACDAMADADDLTIEEFAGFAGLFRDLLRSGVPFDPGFVAGVEALERTTTNRDDDADQDGHDQRLDRDDADLEDEDPDGHDQFLDLEDSDSDRGCDERAMLTLGDEGDQRYLGEGTPGGWVLVLDAQDQRFDGDGQPVIRPDGSLANGDDYEWPPPDEPRDPLPLPPGAAAFEEARRASAATYRPQAEPDVVYHQPADEAEEGGRNAA